MAAPTWCSSEICASIPASWLTVAQAIITVLPIWAFGAVFGYLIPRPKANSGFSWSGLLSSALSGRPRWLVAWHGFVILREVWYHWTAPGTFRRFARAVIGLLLGRGWHFDFPERPDGREAVGTPCVVGALPEPASEAGSWYVTEKDLAFFQYHAETEAPAPGATPWELMMDKDIPNVVKYTAWRRTLANGKTEYKSVTFSPNATAEEFMDLYLDDDYRPNWDTMIIDHEVIEQGDFSERQQAVRWLRRFPFSFITDREYIIAKRMFKIGQDLYGITKAVEHPNAPPPSNVVRMDVFYSMWRSRTVSCPWGSDSPACETLLLHHEQFKIPENLSRFAVKHGMWGFVRKLSIETPKFVEARRARCDPYQADAQAYGHNIAPSVPSQTAVAYADARNLRGVMPSSSNGALLAVHTSASSTPGKPGMRRVNTSTSALSLLSSQSSAELPGVPEMYGDLLYRGSTGGLNGALGNLVVHHTAHHARHGPLSSAAPTAGVEAQDTGSLGQQARRGSSTKLKGLAAFAIASGLALLVQRGSSDRLSRALSNACDDVARKLPRSGSGMRRGRSRVFSEGGSSHSLADLPEVKGH